MGNDEEMQIPAANPTTDPARLLARVSDGIVELDRDWRYTYVNEPGAAQFGRVPADLIGKHIWTEFPEGVGQPFHLAYEKAMAEQLPTAFEAHYAPWDRWFENRVYPSPEGLTIFFHDITARKRAEQAERDANALNRQIVGSAPDGMVVYDRDLRVLDVNAAMVSLWGTSRAAVIGRRPSELSPAPAAKEIEARLRQALAGEVVTMPDQPGLSVGGGRPYWLSRVICPLRDGAGEIIGVLGFAREVTERVLAQAALAASEERLRVALEAAGAGVWDWDLGTGQIAWSREHEKLWGIPPGSFGGTYAEFVAPVHPDDREPVRRALKQAIETRAPFLAEFRLKSPDGTERWMKGSGRTANSGGDPPTRMLGTVMDVTARKRSELLLRCQSRVLERIASDASLAESLEALACGAEALAPGMACSILLLDDEGRHLRHGAAPSLPPAYVAAIDGAAIGLTAGTCGTAAFTGQPVYTEDIALDPRWDDYRAFALPHGLRACWSTPLFDHDRRVRGTFALYYREPGLPEPWHLELIAMATHSAELALAYDRRRTELAASERRYYDLYEHAPDMYLSVDPRTRTICECNATLTRVTGYERSELLGRDVLELYDATCTEQVRQTAAAFLRTGELSDVELRIRCKDGRALDVSLNATAIRGPDGTILRSRSTWRDITRRRRAEEDLQGLSASLLRAQDDERRRIARELHDSTGQNLAALAMNLALLQRRAPAAHAAGLLEECVALTERSAAELRTLSYLLHPPLLEDFGLEQAIREFTDGFARRSGVQVTVECAAPAARAGRDVELALFRVMQESLANVHRHAGSPTASVRLIGEAGRVVLEICDQGIGLPADWAPVGVGIAGMRERLRMLGGQLEVARGSDGTCVRATVPLPEAAR